MKKLTFILICFAMFKLSFSQDSVQPKITELIDAYVNAGKFTGSILVAQRGKILVSGGYGFQNSETKTKNTAQTIYQIASITKSFTSTVIMKLVEAKKLSLSDRLSKFYRGLPNGDSITIEHLLTHTSGLHNYTELDSMITETDEKRMIPFLKTLTPDFAPGSNWHYSNTGYVLLGYVIGKVTGSSYWQVVRNYIFQPLGMRTSGFDFVHLKSPDKSTGYDQSKDGSVTPSYITDSTVPSAAGAIYSTVEELFKFHQGLQTNKVLSAASQVKAYSRPNYGYGWQIDSMFNKRVLSHSGSIHGFGTNFARIPEDDVCIVVLSNRSGSTSETMNITRKLLAILYHQPYTIPVRRTEISLPEDTLKKYTGKYEIADMNLVLDIVLHEGSLMVQPKRNGQPGPPSFMFATDSIHFFDRRDEEVEVTFEFDSSGKVSGFKLVMRGITRLARRTE